MACTCAGRLQGSEFIKVAQEAAATHDFSDKILKKQHC
jgi:hypothetical protein